MLKHVLARAMLVGLVVTSAAACGDNSARCGAGTDDVDGVCTIATRPDASAPCTVGTMRDPTSAQGTCVIDPTVCQDGTVLIGGACIDPAAGTPIDLQEGAEPNGLGVLGVETNAAAPAGAIEVPAIGAPGFVVHGTITPFQDHDGNGALDPDVDTYELAVTAPTLLRVTAAGTARLAAGFIAVDSALTGWQRLGLGVTSGTSDRELLLPAAGTYELAITDVRTLLATAPDSGPTGDYFVTITQLALPTPIAGAAVQTGALGPLDVQLFTVALDTGPSTIELAFAQAAAIPGTVALIDGNVAGVGDGTASAPATIALPGTGAAATATIAIDAVQNVATVPVDFTLTTMTSAGP